MCAKNPEAKAEELINPPERNTESGGPHPAEDSAGSGAANGNASGSEEDVGAGEGDVGNRKSLKKRTRFIRLQEAVPEFARKLHEVDFLFPVRCKCFRCDRPLSETNISFRCHQCSPTREILCETCDELVHGFVNVFGMPYVLR
jgi:hypothetical protein